MRERIAVRMPGRPPIVCDLDAAHDELAPRFEPVGVKAVTDAHQTAARSRKISSARARSAGTVTLKFSALPLDDDHIQPGIFEQRCVVGHANPPRLRRLGERAANHRAFRTAAFAPPIV